MKSFVFESGLADAVDVTGEVERLVGEAPLIVMRYERLFALFNSCHTR